MSAVEDNLKYSPIMRMALAHVRERWLWLDDQQCVDLLTVCAQVANHPSRLEFLTGLPHHRADALWAEQKRQGVPR